MALVCMLWKNKLQLPWSLSVSPFHTCCSCLYVSLVGGSYGCCALFPTWTSSSLKYCAKEVSLDIPSCPSKNESELSVTVTLYPTGNLKASLYSIESVGATIHSEYIHSSSAVIYLTHTYTKSTHLPNVHLKTAELYLILYISGHLLDTHIHTHAIHIYIYTYIHHSHTYLSDLYLKTAELCLILFIPNVPLQCSSSSVCMCVVFICVCLCMYAHVKQTLSILGKGECARVGVRGGGNASTSFRKEA